MKLLMPSPPRKVLLVGPRTKNPRRKMGPRKMIHAWMKGPPRTTKPELQFLFLDA
jgi:hypothetical protein